MICASVVLPRPGRAGEQDVVERVAARDGGLDRDRELLLQRRLADEVLEAARPQRAVELELVLDALRASGCAGGSSGAGRAQRVGDEVLRRVVGRVAQQLVGLDDREAELDEAVAGEAARVVGAGDDDLGAAGRRRRRPSRAARR